MKINDMFVFFFFQLVILCILGCENSGRIYQNGEEYFFSIDVCIKCICQVY